MSHPGALLGSRVQAGPTGATLGNRKHRIMPTLNSTINYRANKRSSPRIVTSSVTSTIYCFINFAIRASRTVLGRRKTGLHE